MMLNNLASIATILGGVIALGTIAGWLLRRYIREMLEGVKNVDRKTATLERNGGSSVADKINQIDKKIDTLGAKFDRHIEWHLNQK